MTSGVSAADTVHDIAVNHSATWWLCDNGVLKAGRWRRRIRLHLLLQHFVFVQKCSSGFYREWNGQRKGQCVPCRCNGLTTECDEHTGNCVVGVPCLAHSVRSTDAKITAWFILIKYTVSRTVSSTLLGTTVRVVRRVAMETQPTGPAVSVHVPLRGTSESCVCHPLWAEDVGCFCITMRLYHLPVWRWPVWTLAQEWWNVCADVVTKDPNVKGETLLYCYWYYSSYSAAVINILWKLPNICELYLTKGHMCHSCLFSP